MLQQWERQQPGRLDVIFAAIRNVAPSQLADVRLFDFVNLTATAAPAAAADDRLQLLQL